MRLLHTSDWHLGRSLFGASLIEDQRHALREILTIVDRFGPDAILIAGDVFDRSVPSEEAVELLDWFLREAVVEREVPTFLIPGNHDSAERLGFGARLLRDRGATIFRKLEDAERGTIVRRRGPPRSTGAASAVVVYGAPYSEPAYVAQELAQPEIRDHDAAMRALCARMRRAHAAGPEPQAPAVLLAHAFVAGGEESPESERPLAVGGSAAVSPAAFEGFAYVALGHLHKPQRAGGERVRYCGSLLAYSKSEAKASAARGGQVALLVDVESDGTCVVGEAPLVPRRPLRALDGALDELLERAQAESEAERDAYVIATLSDSGPVFDAHGKLRAVYPNLLHVARAPSRVPELLPGAASSRVGVERARRGALETFEEFFFAATGAELSELERKLLIETIQSSIGAHRAPGGAGAAG